MFDDLKSQKATYYCQWYNRFNMIFVETLSATISPASNEGLKGSTHSTIDPNESRQSRRSQANSSPLESSSR